jgi:hypothetical protein
LIINFLKLATFPFVAIFSEQGKVHFKAPKEPVLRIRRSEQLAVGFPKTPVMTEV